jgi:hypothetical protein
MSPLIATAEPNQRLVLGSGAPNFWVWETWHCAPAPVAVSRLPSRMASPTATVSRIAAALRRGAASRGSNPPTRRRLALPARKPAARAWMAPFPRLVGLAR